MKKSHRPTIDEILTQFFADLREGKKGLTLTRLMLIEQRLRECVESEADRVLVASDLQILAAERQFDPADAVARTMHADDLVFVLALFVREPWLPEERVQRTRHLQVTEKLTRFLQYYRLIDRFSIACPLIDIEIAVDQDRIVRRDERRAKRLQVAKAKYHG
ncbi:hypothetical protein [Cryobacterium tepidiphilum]|uniref:Uncharacterized protein n=1 Tax=Cryobacterium tepidiphilum TaxID=2486026 RepID=A0A3M8LCT5_9MICO|nr:hypothetical protein [Cryobacterium tepidiphilum]RNE62298.1 hypothetical protein EEJ31_08740 [Cryobacterium tepidiphilum]